MSPEVNRAEAAMTGVGGKGQNAAKAAQTLLSKLRPESMCAVMVAQFLGGTTGDEVQRLLSQQGIQDITTQTGAMTRQLVTLVDYAAGPASGSHVDPVVTELIAPSQPIHDAASREMLAKVTAPWTCARPLGHRPQARTSSTFPPNIGAFYCPKILSRAPTKEAAPSFKCILLMGTWPPHG